MTEPTATLLAPGTHENVPIRTLTVKGYRNGAWGPTGTLERSIQDQGQLNPILVSPTGIVLSGERRLHVLEQLGKTTTTIDVVDTLESFAEIFARQRATEIGGLAMRPSEMAAQMDTVLKAGLAIPSHKSGRSIGELVFMTQAYGFGEQYISSLLLVYRVAVRGEVEEHRVLAHRELQKIDEHRGNVFKTRKQLMEIMKPLYPNTKITYRLTDIHKPTAPEPVHLPAAQQQIIMTRVVHTLQGLKTSIDLLGMRVDGVDGVMRKEAVEEIRAAIRQLRRFATALEDTPEERG